MLPLASPVTWAPHEDCLRKRCAYGLCILTAADDCPETHCVTTLSPAEAVIGDPKAGETCCM